MQAKPAAVQRAARRALTRPSVIMGYPPWQIGLQHACTVPRGHPALLSRKT
jgi:hypothetical protein